MIRSYSTAISRILTKMPELVRCSLKTYYSTGNSFPMEVFSMTFDSHIATLKHAFPKTIPILAGFMFLGISYGLYMNSLGFGPAYAILISIFLLAGSMEVVAGSLLLVRV